MRKIDAKTVVKCDGEGCDLGGGVGPNLTAIRSADMEEVSRVLIERGWSTANVRDLCPRCQRDPK